jgi:hypothetical protein
MRCSIVAALVVQAATGALVAAGAAAAGAFVAVCAKVLNTVIEARASDKIIRFMIFLFE